MYLLIKYIKSVLWRVRKRLSYIEDARCLKVKYAVVCLYTWSALCVCICIVQKFIICTTFAKLTIDVPVK